MASIGQLVRVVAEVSGIDESSVKLIARYVREAGFIGQQSTGAGAARMTPHDASALLIAVNSCVLAKDAARSVEIYYNLPMENVTIKTGENDDLEQIYNIISEREKFGEFLACLIELCMPIASGVTILQYGPDLSPVRIWVEFERPENEVSVNIWECRGESAAGASSAASLGFYFKEPQQDPDEMDRVIKVRISEKTLFTVATLLVT